MLGGVSHGVACLQELLSDLEHGLLGVHGLARAAEQSRGRLHDHVDCKTPTLELFR